MDDDVYRGTTFKSGNSVALRLPKGMGIPEGTEVRMVKDAPMSFRVEAVEGPRRPIAMNGFAGKAPGAKLIPHGDFDERPSTIAKRLAARDA
jgi:antitoxin VapB